MLGIKIGKTFLKGFETRFLFIFIQYSSMATATRSKTETATATATQKIETKLSMKRFGNRYNTIPIQKVGTNQKKKKWNTKHQVNKRTRNKNEKSQNSEWIRKDDGKRNTMKWQLPICSACCMKRSWSYKICDSKTKEHISGNSIMWKWKSIEKKKDTSKDELKHQNTKICTLHRLIMGWLARLFQIIQYSECWNCLNRITEKSNEFIIIIHE